MKIIIILFLSVFFASKIYAKPEYRTEMQNYLKQKNFSFSFENMDISTLKFLLEHEKKVSVLIDPSVNQARTTSIRLKDANFLTYLNITTQKLGLQYQVLNKTTIRIYR